MPFAPGDRIGPYQITGLLGKGGMGEVYRARDPRLERDVAIKVLPAALAQNRERLARFEREAKVLAALNHPNIATIYGLEEVPGNARAIVMELVEGPTLADRMKSGKLSQEETVAIAQQIIAALEAAHEKGVVHRDLKPANVKAPVDSDAPVKVLDFGLATAVQASASEPGDGRGESPTLTMGATEAGVILGTAGYMSPEQAAGKNADKRADIWSFGVVLWEMLTGERLFAGGESISHILADVLRAPIDFEKIPAGALRELLRRCLERDVKTRLRDIGEARVVLSRVGSGAESPAQAEGLAHKGSKMWPAVAAALAISTGVTGWIAWRATQPEDKPIARLEVDLGADVALIQNATQSVVALSPDGTRLAYVSLEPAGSTDAKGGAILFGKGSGRGRGAGGGSRLFVRRLDQVKAVELPDARGAFSVFFSPDGQWIGFYRGFPSMLFKISVDGGAAVPLADLPDSQGGDWSEDGTILVGGSTGLWRIPPGGKAVQLTKTDGSGNGHLYPRFLPGGKAALFTVVSGVMTTTTAVIEAVSLVDGKRKEVLRGGVSPHYLPTGHLVYMSNGALLAIAFDPDKLETRGTPVPILDDVQFNAIIGAANLSFSRRGTLVYRRGETSGQAARGPRATIDWIDASGKHVPLIAEAQRFSRPRISPDGNQLAVLITDSGSRDYWVYDLRRGTRNKITFGGLAVSTVAWTPDSRYIFVGSGQGGSANSVGIFWTTPDGAGQPQRILEEKGGVDFATSYSAAAKRLSYASIGGAIFTIPLAEENGQWKTTGTPAPFGGREFRERMPVFSPDGKWMAYSTDESGQVEVNVRAFPPPASADKGGQGRKWTISTNGGDSPRWSRDGRELLYQERDRIMAVGYTVNGDTFNPGTPRARVEKLGANEEDWDLAPNGRVAAVAPVETAESGAPTVEHTVVFFENFFDEVKRRVK